MALSDILKKYGDTTGIMQQPATSGIVPYKSVASSYSVYNRDTDTLQDQQTFSYEPVGIMAQPTLPEGKPEFIEAPFMPDFDIPFPEPKAEQPFVTGPTGVISYGTTEEGTPRVLTDYRTGEMTYADTGEPYTPPPVEPETPTQPEEPVVDPCPPGYQLVDGVCQPIAKASSDRQEPITVEPRTITNQTRDLKGTVNFDKDISATDPNLREGQYEYNPSRKTLNPFETGGIIGTVMNGLHNVGQWINEQQAMSKGVLRDTNGDGKPDTIDTVQVTRNYQEEELGLPPGARAMGASLSMQKDTQYNTLKSIFEEAQILGEEPKKEEKPTEPKKEEKPAELDTKLTKEVTPRFEGGFGELLGVKEFGQLERDVVNLGNEINANKELQNMYEGQYRAGLITFGQRDNELDRLKNKMVEAQKQLKEKNKKLEEEKKRRQEITDNYNKLQKQKQKEELEKIQKAKKEGKEAPRQEYDKGSQKDRQRDTGKGGTGFSPKSAGPSVKGERLRGGI